MEKTSDIRKTRYRRRENYVTPYDDSYLFCDECRRYNIGECKLHGTLNQIPEKTLSKDVSEFKHALLSLPDELEIKGSSIPDAGNGIFARSIIPKRSRFGPYQGMKLSVPCSIAEIDRRYLWKIMNKGKVSHYLNSKNETNSNWMRYINFSRTENEQNLIAFQYCGDIFYRAHKDIHPGTELLVWYGEYAINLIGDVSTTQSEENIEVYLTDESDILCKHCHLSFSSTTYCEHHEKICSQRPRLTMNTVSTNPIGLIRSITAQLNGSSKTPQMLNVDNNRGQFAKPNKHLYPCTECSKSFSRAIDLKIHKRIHTGEKPHVCHQCGKGFIRTCSLNVHKRLHTGEKPFTCEYCGKTFKDSGNLVSHKRTHTGEKPYICDQCGKGFRQLPHLKRHSIIHGGITPTEKVQPPPTLSEQPPLYIFDVNQPQVDAIKKPKCGICGIEFTSLNELDNHKKTHTGEKPYVCDQCGKGFSTPGPLTKHKRTHNVQRPHLCYQCGKGFHLLIDLDIHKKTHTGEGPCSCDVCGKRFHYLSHLNRHKRAHTGERPYVCEQCGKCFPDVAGLSKHNEIHADKEKSHNCDQCGKSFALLHNLNIHKRIHNEDKLFLCDHCGKGFTHSHSLQVHIRIHTGERPYVCEHCDKSFSDSSCFRRHKLIHTGERPYTCDQCGKSFNRRMNLNAHKLIHTGEKAFQCDLCGNRFTLKGNLNGHRKTCTGQKPYACAQCGKGYMSMKSLTAHQRSNHGLETLRPL